MKQPVFETLAKLRTRQAWNAFEAEQRAKALFIRLVLVAIAVAVILWKVVL